jgi:hypothetical protein
VKFLGALLLLSLASCSAPRTRAMSIEGPAEAVEPTPDPEAELRLQRHLDGPRPLRVEGILWDQVIHMGGQWETDAPKQRTPLFGKGDYGLYANPIP